MWLPWNTTSGFNREFSSLLDNPSNWMLSAFPNQGINNMSLQSCSAREGHLPGCLEQGKRSKVPNASEICFQSVLLWSLSPSPWHQKAPGAVNTWVFNRKNKRTGLAPSSPRCLLRSGLPSGCWVLYHWSSRLLLPNAVAAVSSPAPHLCGLHLFIKSPFWFLVRFQEGIKVCAHRLSTTFTRKLLSLFSKVLYHMTYHIQRKHY